MKTLSAGIVGVTGYAGTELATWLQHHPQIELSRVYSSSNQGRTLSDVVPSLYGCYSLVLEAPTKENFSDIDILFIATPHGTASSVAQDAEHVKWVVDLSRDHRHLKGWVYGQPEWSAESLSNSQRIAAPGCFATAISLGLAPLVKDNALTGSVRVAAATGSSGSGARASATTHHPDRFTNFKAYKILQHQHIPEINSFLSSIGDCPDISFVPLSAPVDRGIFATIFVDVPQDYDIKACFHQAYAGKPCIRLRENTPELRFVRGTGFADMTIHQQGSQGVILVALDNLGKGAASQALQATNISCGFAETTGIDNNHTVR